MSSTNEKNIFVIKRGKFDFDLSSETEGAPLFLNMKPESYTLQKAAAIARGIPLLEKKLLGWQTLYDSYVENAQEEHPGAARILREALPLAKEVLLLARSVEVIMHFADEHTLAGMTCYVSSKQRHLDLLADATYRAIKSEKSSMQELPEELANSDVVRYWQKRYRLKVIIYRTNPYDK